MAHQPRLVNKQFNSPIGLYSENNIQEVLHRDMQILTNGGVGINFYNPSVGKPANLQNSAVLRMLEEESRHGTVKREGTKRIAWPPVENNEEEGGQPQAQQPFSPNSTPSNVNRPPLQPLLISCANTGSNLQSPKSPSLLASPKAFGEAANPKGWAPVLSPSSPKQQGYQQRAITPCHIPNKVKEPPPSTISLRPQAPVSQAPPPVYNSQPATATLKGGNCLRGDLKWPPENVKRQAEEENRLRLELAKGPVFRPRKVRKDYTGFFAQHALNSTYPGYRAPPGTQYYGASDY